MRFFPFSVSSSPFHWRVQHSDAASWVNLESQSARVPPLPVVRTWFASFHLILIGLRGCSNFGERSRFGNSIYPSLFFGSSFSCLPLCCARAVAMPTKRKATSSGLANVTTAPSPNKVLKTDPMAQLMKLNTATVELHRYKTALLRNNAVAKVAKGLLPNFDVKAFGQAMHTAGYYRCDGNMWWVEDTVSAVPYRASGVREIIRQCYPEGTIPQCYHDTITVSVPSVDYDVAANFGNLVTTSPEEDRLAFFGAWLRDVEKSSPETEGLMKTWMRLCEAVPFKFELHTDVDGAHFSSVQIRQNLVSRFHALTRSPFGVIVEIAAFKRVVDARDGKKSAKNIADMYASKVIQSKDAERVSDTFVDNAITIATRVLCHEDIATMFVQLEQRFGAKTPWNSIYKMQTVLQVAGTPAQIRWAFLMLTDSFLAGDVDQDGFSVRSLQGKLGFPGLVQLMNKKLALKKYLLDTWLQTVICNSVVVQQIREKLGDVQTFRAHVQPLPLKLDWEDDTVAAQKCESDDILLSMTWKTGWNEVEELVLQFIEMAVYSNVPNSTLKAAVTNNKSCEELLTC